MKGPQHSAWVERSLHAAFVTVRCVMTAGLFGGLVVAWLLTAPMFHCSMLLGEACRRWDLRFKWR